MFGFALQLRRFVGAGFVLGVAWGAVFLWALVIGKLDATQFLFYTWFLQEIEVLIACALLMLVATGTCALACAIC